MQDLMIHKFFEFIKTRHQIYILRRKGLSFPWVDDPIFNEYKFTNVYRELDAGTVWCRENLREPYADHSELFVNIAMYRRYNWIDTAEALGFMENYNVSKVTRYMLGRQSAGYKIFTGAHMLCGNIRRPDGTLPPTKVEQVFGLSFQALWIKRKEIEPTAEDTLQSAFNKFLKAKVPGYGKFIIYEVISDLRWTRYLDHATDIMEWANPGPGAKRGIRRIYGESGERNTVDPLGFNDNDYIQAMRYLLYASTIILSDDYLPMELRDIEHSLCEFDKYERVRLGQGRPRSKFIPPDHRQV